MGGCLAKNMIKEANFPKNLSDSGQMMLKLVGNIRWVEILQKILDVDESV